MSLLSLFRPVVEMFPRVASAYRGLRDQLDIMEEPRRTPWGFKLAGNKAMAEGDFEPTETELVRKLLKDADVLVNVGANVGFYCCHALSMGKSVIAFEPLAQNLHYLLKNIQVNGWSGAEVYPLALSDKVAILEIYGGSTGASLVKGWGGGAHGYKNLVPTSTLDLVLGKRLDGKRVLALVDIEGAEKWMLDGASLLLANNPKPVWLLEICLTELHPGGKNEQFQKIFEMFWQAGYEAFSIHADMRQVTEADVQRWYDSGVRDFGYVSYLFQEKPRLQASDDGYESKNKQHI